MKAATKASAPMYDSHAPIAPEKLKQTILMILGLSVSLNYYAGGWKCSSDSGYLRC
jgi:hypothetical protein